jgi:phosphonate transport system permease protein
VGGLLIHSFYGTELIDLSWKDIVEIPENIGRLLSDMMPPSSKPIIPAAVAMLQTFQMAMIGTIFGVVVSLPLGMFAAKNLTPHHVFYYLSRGLISVCRSVPDMVWAIFFVIIVGLGPLAGALTLFVDTIGFAGRFFGEAMEEVDPGPGEALSALGATRTGVFFSSIFPAGIPSFVNTTLFSLERAVQSSVVLGLVGAGGIGMLLEEPMTWHNYDEATTVVISIFLMLVIVEQVSARIRRGVIGKASF